MEELEKEIFEITNQKQFNKICFKIFDFQKINNPVYSKYCKIILGNKQPKSIYEIPFLPISFFKTNEVIIKNTNVEKKFYSSGTSGNRSKHLISKLKLYEKSFNKSFEIFYGDIKKYCLISMLPNYRERKDSSLIYMIDNLINYTNYPLSGAYKDNYKSVSDTLDILEKKKKETILIGVNNVLIDLAKNYPKTLKNTIIIETGGNKIEDTKIIKEELHEILKKSFNLENIHSEYGMTELLSQSYSKKNGIFQTPPWKKIIIRDTEDPFTIVNNNKSGGVNIIDLANIYSCSFISTQDIGKKYDDDSFSVLGRFDNSELRGCNLLMQ